jgi:hypothetical protein
MAKKIEKTISEMLNPRFKLKSFESFNSVYFIRERPPLHDVFSFACDRDGDVSCDLSVGVPDVSKIRGKGSYPHITLSKPLSSNVFKNKPNKWYRTREIGALVEEIWNDFEQAESWYKRWTSLEQLAEFERKSLSLYRDGSDGQQHCYLEMAEIYAVMGDSVRVTEALWPLEDLLIEYRKSPKENKFAIDFYEPKVMAVKNYLAKNSHDR